MPFIEYVEAQLKKYKDFAMLKIVPPRGYIARREGFPKLEQLRIQTPIRQHVRDLKPLGWKRSKYLTDLLKK